MNISDKNILKEIKKGQIGTGLLIENEGFISLDYAENKLIKEDMDKQGKEWQVPYPFRLKTVFQKYGIVNANGRVYPENVLKREVEKYQTKINERSSYGECYKPDTLILTENGWKTLNDVEEGENILTLNTDTNNIEIKPIIRKIEYDYDGEMIHIQGRSINDIVTPNHKYPLYDRNKKFKFFKTAEEIFNSDNLSKNYIPKRGIWNEKGEEYFIIKAEDKKNYQTRIINEFPQYFEDLYIPMNTFMKFMGLYLSEGYYDKKYNIVYIAQKKDKVCNLILEMLNELNLKYGITEKKDGTKIYYITDARLKNYIKKFGDCYTKYVPIEVKRQSLENLKTFYDWFVLGNGRKRGIKKETDDVFSVSKKMIMDLNEIQLKIGYSGNYHEEDRKYDRYIKENNGTRLIEGKNCHNMYFSMKSLSEGIYLDKRFINIDKENYNGKVICVEVENHTWYCMCNNKAHWTGNCNHPESATIDLGRICFLITELHWEDHTLVGEIEIPISYGFRKSGIISSLADLLAQWILSGLKVGVSSRGLGSVKNVMGKQIVDDDYEIECWDAVSDPSTPGAYICPNSNTSQYVESNTNNNNKPNIFEKIDKALNILK